ncbi:GIY-YIG nuclease family protein [Aerosakkonemataceae cyanobacterium BLCC-F50]|uniref:GIY-YIG nuclease family protein n=1 Tax=Floridaenema flaviceps BLCC-F50 TaxID=3153642 RepID=A0ABV4XPQ8_9CYAN
MSWSITQRFTPDNVNEVPNNLKGIYAIWGENDNSLYYGMSRSCIKDRLQAHVKKWRNGSKAIAMLLDTGAAGQLFFAYKETNEPRLEEAVLIRSEMPWGNRRRESVRLED